MFRAIRQQRGITGLETAIILIAFVIVASILAYIVISAGLFSSQKAKQAVDNGFAQTGATIELTGNVIASVVDTTATPEIVGDIYFTICGVPGGDPIDLTPPPAAGDTTTPPVNKLVISYNDSYNQYPSLSWTVQFVGSHIGGNILNPGELAQIDVDMSTVNTGAAGDATQELTAYHAFTLEVKPNSGPTLTIDRTLPGNLGKLTNLH